MLGWMAKGGPSGDTRVDGLTGKECNAKDLTKPMTGDNMVGSFCRGFVLLKLFRYVLTMKRWTTVHMIQTTRWKQPRSEFMRASTMLRQAPLAPFTTAQLVRSSIVCCVPDPCLLR